MKGSNAAHSALVNAILATIGTLPGVVAGPNASGLARYMSERTGKRFAVPYGWPTKGGPDILVAVAPFGRLLALECKTGDATPTAEQRACHAALRAVGVAVAVVRSVDDARLALSAMSSESTATVTRGDMAKGKVHSAMNSMAKDDGAKPGVARTIMGD